MALVVETGTIVEDANSYASVEYADAYFVSLGNAIWSELSLLEKEVALAQATAYVDIRWISVLPGEATPFEQPLAFPRYVNSELYFPSRLVKATCEYAVRAAQGPLAPDIAYDDTNRFLSRKLEEVGPIKEDVSFTGRSAFPAQWRMYPIPDAIMQSFLRSNMGRIIRA